MTPMQMSDFSNSIEIIKVAFGRFQMALTMAREEGKVHDLLFHKMVFPAAHKARLEAQAARIQALLDAGQDPVSLINPDLWYAPGTDEKPKLSVFKPKAA